MINSTQLITELQNLTSQTDIVRKTADVFIPSVAAIWIFQFIVTLILGMIFVKEDKGKFFSIFIFVQLIVGILYFLTFIFPVLPQLMSRILGG